MTATNVFQLSQPGNFAFPVSDETYTGNDRDRGIRMPQIVDTRIRNIGTTADSLPDLLHINEV